VRNRAIMAGIICISLISTSVISFADELNDAQSQKSSVDNKLSDINKQKEQQKSQLNSVQKENTNLQNSQSKAESELKKSADELNKSIQEVKDMETSIKTAENSYNKQMEQFKTRLRVMYQNSNNSYINTLASSENATDFLSKLQLITIISKKDKELAISLDGAKKDLDYKKKLKEDEKVKLQAEADAKKKVVSSIQATKAAKEAQEKSINDSLKRLNQEEDNLLLKSKEITNLINTISIRRKGAYVNGQMQWPAPGYSLITSPFSNGRVHPVLGITRAHTGIDIGAAMSSGIVAVNKGTVILAGWQDGYGNTIIIDHGGNISTLYGHSSRLLVSAGQEVEAGQVIAKVGSTGLSTGPHLHFEVRVNGNPVNPLDYVSP